MRTISNYFGLPEDLPFHNVDVEQDNPLFLDLDAIRFHGHADFAVFRSDALASAHSYMEELMAATRERSAESIARASSMLTFPEPWYTRLGLSELGCRGRGGAHGVAEDILAALSEDPQMQHIVGELTKLTQIQFFVEGVGPDICSDITTRVVMNSLLDFTKLMMAEYPELLSETRIENVRAWSRDANAWIDREVELPAPEGQPLVLVPNGWARPNLISKTRSYHGVSVVGHIQQQEAVLLRDGQAIKTNKRALAKRSDLCEIRPTNVRVTSEAMRGGENLLLRYDRHIQDRYGDDEMFAA